MGPAWIAFALVCMVGNVERMEVWGSFCGEGGNATQVCNCHEMHRSGRVD